MYYIRQLAVGDDVNHLSLGNKNHQPLKTFLKTQAISHHVGGMSKTYVLVEETLPLRVVAYVTITCSEIKLEPL